MRIHYFAFSIVLCLTTSIVVAEDLLFDVRSIRDTSTLETEIVHEWQADVRNPAIRQKLVVVTVCEWWPGRKIRLPVTLSAPADGKLCENILVANQSLAVKTAKLSSEQVDLIQNDGIGVALIGMGTIDAMAPARTLHHEMRRRLLSSKDVRFTPAWIWGISQMRALTAATAESDVFRPRKVLATGGSKRGVATAVAGIYDDRFTAILPVVAPPLGNPGGAFVIGTEDESMIRTDQKFFVDLAAGKFRLPESTKKSLDARAKRRSDIRITLEQAREANWTDSEIETITDRVWDACRVVDHLPALRRRGVDIFYNVGTNDSVSPALLELGRRHPDFPICVIPGGQHGGPADVGFTRRVPALRQIKENLTSFARAHFKDARKMLAVPEIEGLWDSETFSLRVSVTFTNDKKPQTNELWWNLNRSEPYTLPFEYDLWTSVPLSRDVAGTYRGIVKFSRPPDRIDYISLHTHVENGLPLTISSPYQRLDTNQ